MERIRLYAHVRTYGRTRIKSGNGTDNTYILKIKAVEPFCGLTANCYKINQAGTKK